MPSSMAPGQARRLRLRAARWNAHDREMPGPGGNAVAPLIILGAAVGLVVLCWSGRWNPDNPADRPPVAAMTATLAQRTRAGWPGPSG